MEQLVKTNTNKRLLLLEDIESENACSIIKSILEINIEDNKLRKEDESYSPEPIIIIINSAGGSVYDGLGIIGAIENSKTPIITACYGCAMSMALFVLASGHQRQCSKYATLMYHELRTEMSDKMSNIENDLAECRRLDDVCNHILLSKTKLSKKDLDVYKRKKSDWFFTPDIAIMKGFIDEII